MDQYITFFITEYPELFIYTSIIFIGLISGAIGYLIGANNKDIYLEPWKESRK